MTPTAGRQLHWVARIATLALLSGLSACSLFSSEDEQEPAGLVDFEEIVELDSQWSRRLGDQGDDELYLRIQPVIDGDSIYAANVDGKVYAFDRHEGDRHWKTDVDTSLIGAVGAGGGLVFLSTSEGVLIALRQQDGSEAWRNTLSSETIAPAVAENDTVVVLSLDGNAMGFDVATGEKLWTYNTPVPALTLRTSATPLLENGIAYVVFPNGEMMALNARTGLLLWKVQVALPKGRNELERLISFDGEPLTSGNDMYVGSYQGNVSSLDKQRGRLQWQEGVSVVGSLAADKGNLYLTQEDDTVVALKMATGRRLWENSQMAHRQLTAPVVLGDFIVVGDGEGYLHVLRQSDGSFAGRENAGGEGFRNALFSDGETLYALVNSGKLRAYQLAEP